MTTFSHIRTLPDQVRDQIVEELRTGDYEIGDRLPTLDDWTKRFQVSRRTVQMAIDQLRSEGLLQSRVGRGAHLVRKPGSPSPARSSSKSIAGHKPLVEAGDQTRGSTHSHRPQYTFAVLDGLAEVNLNNEIGESWTTRILHGIRLMASELNIDLLLINDKIDMSTPQSIGQHLREISSRVDGLITFPLMPHEEISTVLDGEPLPIVTINRFSADTQYNFVSADYFGGSRLVGRMFAECDMNNVWFLSTQVANVYSKEQRYAGLCDGLLSGGVANKARVVIADSAEEQAGFDCVMAKLQETKPPEAIYCSGDYLAIGAMRALKESGIPVGDDDGVAVVGSSGFAHSQFSSPSLSVVRIPMEEMGRQAISSLNDMVTSESLRLPGRSLPTDLILRGSTPTRIKESGWLEKQSPPNPGIDL